MFATKLTLLVICSYFSLCLFFIFLPFAGIAFSSIREVLAKTFAKGGVNQFDAWFCLIPLTHTIRIRL